jgi:hypothetical protein
VRSQQKVFNTSTWYDYPLAFLIAAALSFAGSFVVSFVGFFTLFLAPIAGMIAAEAVRMATQKRRSKTLYLPQGGGFAGQLAAAGRTVIKPLSSGAAPTSSGLLWRAFMLTVTTSVYYRLRGINIR